MTVGGAPALKATRMVDPGEAVELTGPPPRFVGRGGYKLESALEHFGIDSAGMRVLDAGASTGGFTDCLLQHGAREVIAIDVGHGQLDARLRMDARVRNLERTNIRNLDERLVGDPVDLVVADLSFISLRLVLDALLSACRPQAPLVLLVKPQFEAGRTEADRARGVITDPAIWRRTLDEVISAAQSRGATIMGVMVSPIRGAQGNVEFLLHLVAPGAAAREGAGVELDAVVAQAQRMRAG